MSDLKPQIWRNQLSSLMLQVHLPLCPQPQTPKITIPEIPGEPSIGTEFNICQPLSQTTPMTGSRLTSVSKKSWQVGSENLGPSTTRVQGHSVTPKSRNW